MDDEIENKQDEKRLTGIEKLMSNLEHARNGNKRLTHKLINRIFRQVRSEIPYAQMMSVTLAESLLADTPQVTTNLTPNEIIVNCGRILCNPNLKDELTSLVRTYLHQRKKAEKEYATLVLNKILKAEDLEQFPERVRPILKELSQFIMEKVINEKQLRRLHGYRLQPLIELVEPFIYQRLFNVALERVREAQRLPFRKLVNKVAQSGYDAADDDETLSKIRQDKEAALTAFRHAVAEKAPSLINISHLQVRIQLIQKDRTEKHRLLQKQLDEFLKPIDAKMGQEYLSSELRSRFSARLTKLLLDAEQNPQIYSSDEAIKKIHDEAFNEVDNDAKAIRNLVTIVGAIKENFSKKIWQKWLGRKQLKLVDDTLLDSVLGKTLPIMDANTGGVQLIRVGGYPQRNIVDIYTNLGNMLTTINKNLSGMFADKLKDELKRAAENLQFASKNLTFVSPVKLKVEVPAAELQQAEKIEPKPLVIEDDGDAAIPIMVKPLLIEEVEPSVTFEKVEIKPLLIVDDAELEAELPQKVEPKPLFIPDDDIEFELEKIAPPPLLIVDDEKIESEFPEKVEPKPLLIMEEDVESELPAPVQPKPLMIMDDLELEPELTEKIEPKPLLIMGDDELELESKSKSSQTVQPKPLLMPDDVALESHEVEAVMPQPVPFVEKIESASILEFSLDQMEAIDAGVMIMKNYQLGDMESSVYHAWESIVIAEQDATAGIESGLGSDDEIRLYVICDLVQQVVGVPAAMLSKDQSRDLQSIKDSLTEVLKNPSEINNWDYFEGKQRDYIDGILATFMAKK